MSVVGTTNILKKVTGMEKSPSLLGYTKVVIQVTDDLYYEAGLDTGRTLELKCPWGTKQMAEDILVSVKGFEYQPYTADGALVDPGTELGDGITVNGVYSGIYKQETEFDALCSSKIEAPQDEELDHEYPFQEVTDREVIRQQANTRAQFAVQASEIAARVTREGGDNASFGWSLTEDGFILSSGSKEVFKAHEGGIAVTGTITAGGHIGDGDKGFTIDATAIRNNKPSFEDEDNPGVYIGTDGIALGSGGAFKVSKTGVITATSGTIGGFEIGSNFIKGGALTLNSDGRIGGTKWSISADGYANFKNFNGNGSLTGSFSGGGASFTSGGTAFLSSANTYMTDGKTSVSMSAYIKNLAADHVKTQMADVNYRMTYRGFPVKWGSINGYPVLTQGY